MPSVSSQAPSRSGSMSFCTGRSRAASGHPPPLPSISPVSGAMQLPALHGHAFVRKAGGTPPRPAFGAQLQLTTSAQKSPNCASCASVHTGPGCWRRRGGATAACWRPQASGPGPTRGPWRRPRPPGCGCMRSTGPPVSNNSCTGAGRAPRMDVGAGGARWRHLSVRYVQSIHPASRCRRAGPACPGVACPASHHHGPGSSKVSRGELAWEPRLRRRRRPGATAGAAPHQRHHLRGFVVRQRGHGPQLSGVGSIAQRLHPRLNHRRPVQPVQCRISVWPPDGAIGRF